MFNEVFLSFWYDVKLHKLLFNYVINNFVDKYNIKNENHLDQEEI